MKSIYLFIKYKYMELLIWWDGIKDKYEPRYVNPATAQIVINSQQVKYEQGVKQIKVKVNNLLEAKTKDEYNKALLELNELLTLAKDDDPGKAKTMEAIHRAWVYQGSDIKSTTDKAKMVETRIQHYRELQEHKKHRETLRELRKRNGK